MTDCWSFIPRIYVATIENSKRIRQVQKDLSDMGVVNYEFNYQVPPVVKSYVNVSLSCTDNHLQIYRKALRCGYKYVCVFEDDVFTRTREKIPFVLQNVKKFVESTVNWDVLYLGHFPWKIGKEVSQGICESISWCTHSYLITDKAMRYMLRYSPEDMMKIGRLAVPSIFDMFFIEGGGIDTFLAYSAYRNKIHSHAVFPMLIEQSSIAKWSMKAKLAQRFSKGEWWPNRVFTCMWLLYWAILIVIIYVLRKNLSLR
jgi:hypothetical protein